MERKGTACTSCSANRFKPQASTDLHLEDGAEIEELCKPCPNGAISDNTRTNCVCPINFYNVSYGRITCYDKHKEMKLGDSETQKDVAGLQVCQSCDSLECIDCSQKSQHEVWSHVTIQPGYGLPTALADRYQGLQSGAPNDPKNIFECPETMIECKGEARGQFGGLLACKPGHTGLLCHMCESGYGRTGGGVCQSCAEASGILSPSAVVTLLGATLFLYMCLQIKRRRDRRANSMLLDAVWSATENTGGGAPMPVSSTTTDLNMDRIEPSRARAPSKFSSQTLWVYIRFLMFPLRIMVGFAQVYAHLPRVLEMTLPPHITYHTGWLLPLSNPIDIVSTLLGWSSECANIDYYVMWGVKIFMEPAILLACCAMYKVYEVRIQGRETGDAVAHLRANMYFVLFLVYPTICNSAFSVYECRRLAENTVVLQADYAISCTSQSHWWVQNVSSVVVVTSLALPLFMGVIFVRIGRRLRVMSPAQQELVNLISQQLGVGERKVANALLDVTGEYATSRSFLWQFLIVNGVKGTCLYWEAIDQLRKAVLVGLMVLIARGTVFQEFCAILMAMWFLCMHLRIWPYKHVEDNILKVLVELQIVATVIGSLASNQSSDEPVGGWIHFGTTSIVDVFLTVLFDCILLAFVVCIMWKLFKLHRVLYASRVEFLTEDRGHRTRLRASLRLHSMGIADESDCAFLCEYFESVSKTARRNVLTSTIEGEHRELSDQEDANIATVVDRLHSDCCQQEPDEAASLQPPTQLRDEVPLAGLRSEAAGSHPTDSSYYNKFDAGFVGSFGDMADFYGGLEHLIGECRKDVLRAMEEEHCSVTEGFGASHSSFTTSNYAVTTMPSEEWSFVVSEKHTKPMQAGSGNARGFREKRDAGDLLHCAAELITHSFASSGYTAVVTAAEVKALPLLLPEVISLRLYTGPMFELYNWVLRAYGTPDNRAHVPAYSRVYPGATVRGCFTSTLHTINSGVLKLSRLQPSTTIYRGISGMKLPRQFLVANEQNVRGGVEYGFMSTTLDESVAISYAKGGDTDTASTVIQATMGIVDRGAQLDWLSQYPHEKEILLPPLTATEVVNIETEENQAGYQICRVTVRLNCNLISMTLERFLAVRKKEVESLVGIIYKDLSKREADIDTVKRSSQARQLEIAVRNEPADNFNENQCFTESVRQALSLLPKTGDELESLSHHRGELCALECGTVEIGSCGKSCRQSFLVSSALESRITIWMPDGATSVTPSDVDLSTGHLKSGVLTIHYLSVIESIICGSFDGSVCIFRVDAPADHSVIHNAVDGSGPITALASVVCGKLLYVAAGCMDGSIFLWSNRYDENATKWTLLHVHNGGHDEHPAGTLQSVSDELTANPMYNGAAPTNFDSSDHDSIRRPEASQTTSCGAIALKLKSCYESHLAHEAEGLKAVRALLWVKVHGNDVLLSGSFDSRIRVWSCSAGVDDDTTLSPLIAAGSLSDTVNFGTVPEFCAHTGAITALIAIEVPGASSSLVASGSEDGNIKIWDPQSAAMLRVISNHRKGVCALVWLPAAQWLVSGSADNTIKLFDIRLGSPSEVPRLIVSIQGHSGPVHALAWMEREKRLASGSSDGSIKLWRVEWPTSVVTPDTVRNTTAAN
jgi:WD40 repeat protein